MAVLKTSVHGQIWWGLVRRQLRLLFGLALLASTAQAEAAESAPSPEYQLKAVFLFNFAQFVEWPARAFPKLDTPLVIGVLGDDPFGDYLDELVRGEKIGSRLLVARRFKRGDEIGECHILYVSASESAVLGATLEVMKGRSVLTVSDLEVFTKQGGLVRFVTESGKIRLRINVEAAGACGLKISSKILRPATVVTAGKD